VWPSFKTIRVEATFKPNLRTVAINNKLGKDEKSNGRCVCNATIKISKDNVIFRTKKVSNKATGSGNMSIATSAIIPKGKNEFTKLGAKPLKLNVFAFSISSSKFNVSNF
jgi:hypothetical protein